MTLLRVAVATVAWLVLGAAALLLSLAYHVQLPIAREVARDTLNAFVSGEIRGRLRIGRIDELGPGRAVARHVQLFDPYGNRVAVADRLVLTPDLDAAVGGTLRFSSAKLTDGTVHLIASPREDSVLPTFVETFEPARPPAPGSEPLHAVVDGILVENTVVYGSLLGLDGLRVNDVRLTGRIEADEQLEVRVFSGDGDVVRPFPFTGDVGRLSGVISTDPRVGVRLTTAGRIERADGPDDVVAANVSYAVPEGGAPEDEPRLDVLVHGTPVHARFLPEVGYAWAEILAPDAEIDGYFRLRGPVERLEMRVWAETSGGHVQVVGGINPTEVDITGRTPGLEVARVLDQWPDVQVAGRGRMQIDTSREDAPARIRIEGEPFLWESFAVPALVLEGDVHEDHLWIDSVDAPYTGGEMSGSGRYGFDGSIDVRVAGHIPQIAADPNIRRYVPGARGSMRLDARLTRAGEGSDRFRVEGLLVLGRFRYGPLAAERLRIDGRVGGDPSAPRVDVLVDGRGVSVADYPLGRARVQLAGGPRRYHASGRFHESERQLSFDARVERSGRDFVLDAEQVELALSRDRVWRGAVERVVYTPDRRIEAATIRLASGSQRLEAHGVYRFHGPEEIRAQLQDFDLDALGALFADAMPDIRGRLDSSLELTGDIERPNVVADGFLREGSVYGIPGVSVLYAVAYEDGNLTVDGQVDLGDRGSLTLSGTGLLDPSIPDPIEALEGGIYDLDLGIGDVRLAVLRSVVGDAMPPVEGVVAGTVRMDGPIFAPALTASLHVPELSIPGFDPVGVDTEMRYESGVLVGRVTTRDRRGELAEAEGSLLIDLVNLVVDPDETVASLESLPWRISLRLPPRPLGELPATLAAAIPEDLHPLRVSASGTFQGGAFETRGDLIANAVWEGDPRAITCDAAGTPRAELTATLAGGVTTVRARGFVGPYRLVRVEATAPTPVEEWLREAEVPALPAVRMTAFVENAPTSRIPIVCEYADGPLAAALEVNDLFGEQPTARLEVNSAALRILETEPVRLEGLAMVADGALTGEGTVSWWSGARAVVDLGVPVAWGPSEVLPRVADGAIRFEGDFEAAPIGPFLAWLPQIDDVAGAMDGHVTASGPLDALEITGGVEIDDGYLEIAGLGQQLTDVSGAVELHGSWAQLRGFRAWDGDGLLRIDGGIGFDGYRPSRARLALNADSFPVRREGTILATLTGNATLTASIGADTSDVDLRVNRLNVRLPEQETRSVQALEDHPDIELVGVEAERTASEAPYRIRIGVDASEPFWVRRNDFATRVTADLDVEYVDPDLRVRGDVVLRRGFFDVFGKRFVVDRGSMHFDGSTEIDPEVILVATHEMRDRTTVNVTVTGTLTEPSVEFRSSHPECVEREQVVTMLISGRCSLADQQSDDGSDLADQAVSVLQGITAGVLTLSLRQELGDVLPVIAVESGGTLGRGRIRAGFDASSVIPELLRGVVTGAYVEGVIAAEGEQGQQERQGGVQPGFLIELQFPHDLGTSFEMQTDSDWRWDFTWDP